MNKELLRRVLISQKEEISEFGKERLIEREMLPTAEKFRKAKLIKVITGVRRCGKSTFCRQLLKNEQFAYINFDDERLSSLTYEAADNILEILHEIYGDFTYLFLDEIQNIQKWELIANRLQRQGYNLIITGSNAKLLSKELSSHLTGRYVEIEIFPFSFREYLDYKKVRFTKEELYLPKNTAAVKKHLQDYIKTGGFPEALKYGESKTYLSNLYNGILGKDVILRYNIKYSKTLRDISNYVISNYAKEISYNKMKNMFGVKSVHTIKNYVSYLQESYMVTQLNAFSYKVKAQLIGPKKIYAIDTGLVNAISPAAVDCKGRMLENLVYLGLKRKSSANPENEIFFWKDHQKREVDFVVKAGTKIEQLIQVSFSLEGNKTLDREISSLKKASIDLKCKKLSIITWSEDKVIKQGGLEIELKPTWKWLLDY